MSSIIDRRPNGRHKNAANRERFIRRYKQQIKRAIADTISGRSIKDMDGAAEVTIDERGITEPSFRNGQGGNNIWVNPGNRKFVPGDEIPKPKEGGGQGGHGGEGEDSFTFTLSREEFMQLFFDDLELPNRLREELAQSPELKSRNAGYAREGSPSRLSVMRTMRQASARALALSDDPDDEEKELEALLAEARARGDSLATIAEIERQLMALQEVRLDRVPYLEELDLRYRNRTTYPAPAFKAVMFCLMDVSGSMDEHKKDLAKRFFTLLHLFLTRKYDQVDLVFIRHTETAQEVDEQTFFFDRQSGGTRVASALELMIDIMKARYSRGWNVYAAQASDGDCLMDDGVRSVGLLQNEIFPKLRYFAYIETRDEDDFSMRPTGLWSAYSPLDGRPVFSMRHVAAPNEIYPVFRGLFEKRVTEKR
ncbi:YeaH/YhbH family protein [Derxia gummosa]|uniref:UPF0229 protein n=1 Tax=Derxia gummosa DSM 723 TaxID=1121388 RepID=A0A8B6X2C5_9BURK|nr:YeaH/YhbH family protein [Derxia gummosa]